MSFALPKGARVLITGGGGVLGTALIARVNAENGVKLSAPTRADCDLLSETDVDKVFAAFKPTIVFHLAGKVFGVQGNLEFCGQSFYENTKMNMNVIEAARKYKTKKIVVAGTAAIYSDLAKLPMKETDFWLGAPHGSEGAYGHAKRAMLAQLEAYQEQYGLKFAYLILTNLFGPNDRFDEKFGHVVPSLISRFSKAVAEGKDEVVVWGDGSPTRDFLYADDAAEAFIAAAQSGSGTMNVATGNAVPIKRLVEVVAAATGFKGRIVWDTTKPLGQLERSYDVSRLKALGWVPQVTLEDGIKRAVAWFAENGPLVRT